MKNNEFWSADFELGSSEQNEQHHEILRQLNVIRHNIEVKAREESTRLAFAQLIGFLRYHSNFEIKKMRLAKYPLVDKHERYHEYFLNRLISLWEVFLEKGSDNDSREQIDTLIKWFCNHIRYQDRDFSDFLFR